MGLLILNIMVTVGISCIDPLTIKAEQEEQLLVIDGTFTTLDEPHRLNLTYTRDIGARNRLPVLNAQITIFDNQNNQANYRELGNGEYLLDEDSFRGVEGRIYHVEINVPNGKTYKTVPQEIPLSVAPNRLGFKIEKDQLVSAFEIPVEKSFIKLYIDTPTKIGAEDAFFRWRVDEVYSFTDEICGQLDVAGVCWVYLTPKQEITIFDGRDFAGDIVENIPVYSKLLVPKTPEYNAKHAFNVYQQSISKETYNYWQTVNKIVNQTGSIFDPPPAGIRGNGYNIADENELVLGYFEVASVEVIRVFVRPIDFQGLYQFETYCSNVFPSRFTRDCCDCLELEGSTKTAPDYW